MRKPFTTAPKFLLLLIIALISLTEQDVVAQEENDHPNSELFELDNPFEFDLIFNVKQFVKNKDEEEYVDAVIAYDNSEGMRVEKKVKIRPRGHSRKNICYLPPIRMDFDDEDYGVELFDSFGKVKLVSTCKVASNHEQFLIKEYLAYKIYEYITDISFRTYFLKINFIDSEDKKKPFTSYSFFLEDIDDLAERNNAIEIENMGLLPAHMDKPTMNLFAMYQYMISNVDWHIPNLHNVKLIKSMDTHKPLPMPVPYDLDYCGLVSTNYAVPQDRIPIESITERYWMGTCLEDEEYEEVINTFLAHKEEILGMFENCDLLDKFNQRSCIRYIEQFYDLIEKGEQSKSTVLANCN